MGCLLSDPFDHGGTHLYGGTTQAVDADHNGGLPFNGDQLAGEAFERTADHLHPLSRLQVTSIEADRCLGVVDHEAKRLHLYVGDHGWAVFATEYHKTDHRRKL